MKKASLRSVYGAVLTVFVIAIAAPIWLSGQDLGKNAVIEQQSFVGKGARGIEGVWNVNVTIVDCSTGGPLATFRAMDMFHQGGTMTDTNAAPTATRGPGFGTWNSLGDGHFSSTLRFFMYTNGAFSGVRRIEQDITLDPEADTWSSTVATTTTDLVGNVVVGCGAAAATRAP